MYTYIYIHIYRERMPRGARGADPDEDGVRVCGPDEIPVPAFSLSSLLVVVVVVVLVVVVVGACAGQMQRLDHSILCNMLLYKMLNIMLYYTILQCTSYYII